MYDWANSAYATTIGTAILPIYFASVVVPTEGFRIGGSVYPAESLWGFMVAAAAVFVFLAAPTFGAVADFAAAKKRFLLTSCYAGVIGAIGLSFMGEGDVWLTMFLFIVSQMGFLAANVFYDSFLPLISPEGKQDWVSSKGFAYGYVGGGIQFALSLGLIAGHSALGISEAQAARYGILMAALWWGGFALVTAFTLKEAPSDAVLPDEYRRIPLGLGYIAVGFSRVWETMRKVGRLKHLALFLVAFMVYNDGIQTVIEMAAIYGKQELGLPSTALMVTLLIVQFVALAGALLFAWIANRIGTKRGIMVALVGWSVVVVFAYFIRTTTEYFVLGAIVGLVMGGSQPLSRSLYGSMIPRHASAEFFGFYSVFSKFSSIWGPIVFALIRLWTGSSRNAIVSLILFFVLGLGLLALVNEKEAREGGTSLKIQPDT